MGHMLCLYVAVLCCAASDACAVLSAVCCLQALAWWCSGWPDLCHLLLHAFCTSICLQDMHHVAA